MRIKLFSKKLQYRGFDEATLKHNLAMHLGDGILFMFAMSFVPVQTIFPVLITRLGGSAIAVGFIPVLWNLGLNLPQILLVRSGQVNDSVMPLIRRYGFLHRFGFFVMAVFLFTAAEYILRGNGVVPALIVISFIAVSGSLAIPNWYQLYAKTTPVTLRGRILAVRQFTGSFLGIGGGILAALVIGSFVFPLNFAILFLAASVILMVSYYFLISIREISHEDEETNADALNAGSLSERMKFILRERRNFRNYIAADFLLLMSLSANSFFAVYGLQKFSLPSSHAGIYTVVLMASLAAGNIAFGYLGDRKGHLINLRVLASCSAAASLSAFLISSVFMYYLVIIFMGMTLCIQGISRLSFAAELSREKERVAYLALLNFLTAPAFLFGIAAGYIIESMGYNVLFLVTAAFALLSLFILLTKVHEPRKAV